MSPATSLALGFALILAGFLVHFLMVMQVLESGLVLGVSAYGAFGFIALRSLSLQQLTTRRMIESDSDNES